MNSDLVYKKKYLKYKNKYTALQREMNVQEGGLSFSAIKPQNVKSGIYLFFVNDPSKYNKLLDQFILPKDVFLRDSGVEISNELGVGCYYVERKMNVAGRLLGSVGVKIVPTINLKECVTGTSIEIEGVDFTNKNESLESISVTLGGIKRKIQELTHFFIVEFNTAKSNRISCLRSL